jgi:hypothetical protein
VELENLLAKPGGINQADGQHPFGGTGKDEEEAFFIRKKGPPRG